MKMKKKYRPSSTNTINYRKRRPKQPIKEKEMIILSHNINIDGMSKQRVDESMAEYVNNIENILYGCNDYGIVVKNLYVPVRNGQESKIELLHPSENYLDALNPLEKIDRYKRKVRIFKFLENLEIENEEDAT